MNSLIVLSWVATGFFVAWIATHFTRDRSRGGGVGNLAVSVLGALLGGLGAQGLVRGAHGYHPFIICAGAALVGSAVLLGITRFFPRRRHQSVVY
jgi:uncharacterized membrane protein YeaQ/YmgE (transglycosylase-associated protein family)